MDLGADTVIAVKLGSGGAARSVAARSNVASPAGPSIFHTIMHSIDMMQSRIVTATVAAATLQIDLDCSVLPNPGLRRFSAGRQYIEVGEAAAREALRSLVNALPWLDA